ncbi:fad-dependent pyridine nucleotide reductase signature [Lucifera butyrica]|uniref:L-aspartate oxidase n=1 Tax=Lucifera butyrica TaxID=1351585 RepID=A0A498R9C5_9FIRM|nr:L-aspartate oxidase [Lucifera butyrica]VBB06743.1 fad-dependent pyridine nucleotide reductase signature [Lucifera butyrica]
MFYRNSAEDRQVYDVVVIGSGIAGMAAALSLNPGLKVALVSKERLSASSTYKAQGGMAVAIGKEDSFQEHIADTLRVGRGLCRPEAVKVMVEGGPAALKFLQSLGADFNHKETDLYLTREGGHSRRRIVHYYDYTGKHIAEIMAAAMPGRVNIDRWENCFLTGILTQDRQCCGCTLLYNGQVVVLQAGAVVVATGGYSGLFARSTNPAAGGDGIATAYRAGAVIADMEFVQFHPTTFTAPGREVFLLTEALRGEGALLRNAAGERFMTAYHPDGELAPRDEVSRAILQEMKQAGQEFVYLDARHLGRKFLTDRFRQVYAELESAGYLLERDLIPVAPAAHYAIGGILTDLWGKTTLDGLYACGEAAATGVHGANRLASNSLLESVVFGRRAAIAIEQELRRTVRPEIPDKTGEKGCRINCQRLGAELERAAGAVRREEAMKSLLEQLQCRPEEYDVSLTAEWYQEFNSLLLARMLLEAAIIRRESRGTHYRSDYPRKNDADFNRHIIHQWGKKAVLDE